MSLLRQAARILRPGGLFLAAEWGAYPALHPSHPAAAHAAIELPNTAQFCDALNERTKSVVLYLPRFARAYTMCSHGAPVLALALPALISTTRAFGPSTTRTRAIPVGAPLPGVGPAEVQSNVGEVMHRCFEGFVDAAAAAHPVLGQHAALVKHEVVTHPGTVAVWHTLHAHRL